ncbi:predicted ORF [Xanthomonas phage XacN1]|nr:predicted ORF [Xanthomonas phage XacN1]BBA65664.1 predicted ORF [Xanthomonas phage XacN1]
MQTSDELVTDLTAEGKEIDSAELQKAADDYLNQLRMQQLFSQWSRTRTGKHNAARAQRAKARIAKRKSKR